MSELLKFNSVQRWMQRLETRRKGSPSTRRVFLYYFGRFCKFAKQTPDALIEQRRSQMKSDDEIERRRHEEMVGSFAKQLRDKGASPNTVSLAVTSVRSFYLANYLPLIDVAVQTPYVLRQVKVPTQEELRVLCESKRVVKWPWLKAWVLCQAESGLANIDLLQLELESKMCFSAEFGFLGDQLKNNIVPVHLHVIREKTVHFSGVGFFDTFLGKNSVEALKVHVDFRKPRLFNMTSRAAEIEVKRAGEEAGISSKDLPLVPYSFRKYFTTRLKMAGMNNDIVEYMCGHSLGRTRGAYLVPSVLELRDLYVKYYPKLSVARGKKKHNVK